MENVYPFSLVRSSIRPAFITPDALTFQSAACPNINALGGAYI